jgi:hypothetical protein
MLACMILNLTEVNTLTADLDLGPSATTILEATSVHIIADNITGLEKSPVGHWSQSLDSEPRRVPYEGGICLLWVIEIAHPDTGPF